jgi:hypothetical protein
MRRCRHFDGAALTAAGISDLIGDTVSASFRLSDGATPNGGQLVFFVSKDGDDYGDLTSCFAPGSDWGSLSVDLNNPAGWVPLLGSGDLGVQNAWQSPDSIGYAFVGATGPAAGQIQMGNFEIISDPSSGGSTPELPLVALLGVLPLGLAWIRLRRDS